MPDAAHAKAMLVVVLGSHRSGTSATTRALSVMGVAMGENLLCAEPRNPKGFFEDVDVIAFNEEMLQFLGLNWAVLAPISATQIQNLVDAGYRDRAASMLQTKLAGHAAFGLKDPRITRLLNFWAPVFDKTGRDVRYVLALRDPASVASSLHAAHGLQIVHGYYVWLAHMASAILHADDGQTCVLEYDALISDPSTEVRKLAAHLDLAIDAEELQEYAGDFIDPALRSGSVSAQQLRREPNCPEIVADAFDTLKRLCADPNPQNWTRAKEGARTWVSAMAAQSHTMVELEQSFTPPVPKTPSFSEKLQWHLKKVMAAVRGGS